MKKIIFTLLITIFSITVHAAATIDKTIELQKQWDQISFGINNKSDKKKEFQKLSEKADFYLKEYPNSAEIKAWAGIIYSTEASFYKLNIPKALKVISKAKDVLDEAIMINPEVLKGGVYSSLGLMYSKVPGKPISFGDKVLAKTFLLKGLELNSDGMIANYFLAQYYYNEKDYETALSYFEKSKKGIFPPDREVAKVGTIKEINIWIEKTKSQI